MKTERNKLNKQQRGILYGMSLGDGGIYITKDQSKSTAKLVIGHSPKQRSYLDHKVQLLHSIFGGKVSKINSYTSFNKTVKKSYENLQVCRTEKYFRQMHRVLYPKGHKVYTRKALDFLTDQGLAIWYMDDGSGTLCKNKEGKICGCMTRISTYCSEEEIQIIQKWFEDKYGIHVKVDCDKRNNKYSVRMNTSESRKFVSIISTYMHESMKYKIEHVDSYPPRVRDSHSRDDIV